MEMFQMYVTGQSKMAVGYLMNYQIDFAKIRVVRMLLLSS